MVLSDSSLILDKIRQAALPQRLSLELTIAHATATERFARGEHPEIAIQGLCQWLDETLKNWKPVILVDLGKGPLALGKAVAIDEKYLAAMFNSLRQVHEFEVASPAGKLADPGLWKKFCPDRKINQFSLFHVAESGLLVLTSEQSQVLDPTELSLARLVATSVSFFAAGGPALRGPAMSLTAAEATPLDHPACRSLLRHLLSEACCLLDESGKIIDANAATTRLLEFPFRELLGQPISRFAANAEAKTLLQKQLVNIEASSPAICLRQPAKGTLVWAEASAVHVPPESAVAGDSSAHTILVLRDVSGEKRLKGLLQSSRDQLGAAIMSPSLLMFRVDRRGAIVSAEGGLMDVMDLKTDDLVERNVWGFCQDPALRKRLWRQLRRHGQATAEIPTPYGLTNVNLAATLGPNGRPQSVTGLALITGSGSLAKAPQTSAPPANSTTSPDFALPPWPDAFQAAVEAVVILDGEGLIRFMNPAAESLFALRLSEVKGQPFTRAGSFGGKKSLTSFLAEPQQTGAVHQLCLLRHDGKALDLGLVRAPLGDDAKQGFIICCREEATPQPASEAPGVDLRRVEQESFKALGTFAGGIAHDLNNILTSLVGNVSLANMLVTEIPEASERLIEAERACFRAKDLSHQLLTFAKGSTPVKKVTRLEDLVQQCAEFYLRGSKAAPRIVTKPGLWSVNVDEGQISQVLENLILNADYSMPLGGVVTIACENFHHVRSQGDASLPLEDGLYVKVTVTDEGPGIPEDQLANIFKPYHRANESGRGLGLATTFTITKNHGGHISARSSLGEGTEFTFYLPATGKTKQPVQEKINFDSGDGKGAGHGRILVIDDEKSIRDLATTTLKLMGCDVVTCASASEGVERYIMENHQGSPFDLVIMDLTIPGDIGGNEAMQQILNIAPQARGIASSGYSEGNVMAHYREYGFQAALSKPYNIGDLQRIVSNMLMG